MANSHFKRNLIHTCTVERAVTAASGSGEPIETWLDVATGVRCRLIRRVERYPAERQSEERLMTDWLLTEPGAVIQEGDRVYGFTYYSDGTVYDAGKYAVLSRKVRSGRGHRHNMYEVEQVAPALLWYRMVGVSLPLAAYQPRGAASLAGSYTDLSGNGNDCGPGVAPTWNAADGWDLNGVDQYLDTGIVPLAAYTIIAQFTEFSPLNSNGTLWGQGQSGYIQMVRPQNGPNLRIGYAWGSGSMSQTPALAEGNIAIAGNGLDGTPRGYRDGVLDATLPVTGFTPGPYTVYIGARNLWGAADRFGQCKMQAFAIYDVTLTGMQIAAVAAAMAAL